MDWIGIMTMSFTGWRDGDMYSAYCTLSQHPLGNIIMMPIEDVEQGTYRNFKDALAVTELKWLLRAGS